MSCIASDLLNDIIYSIFFEFLNLLISIIIIQMSSLLFLYGKTEQLLININLTSNLKLVSGLKFKRDVEYDKIGLFSS